VHIDLCVENIGGEGKKPSFNQARLGLVVWIGLGSGPKQEEDNKGEFFFLDCTLSVTNINKWWNKQSE
jgi:hypothetical protein